MARFHLCKEAAIIFVIVSILSQIHAVRVVSRNEKCTSAVCEAIGKEISDGMDKTHNPCDDFYQSACGSWIARNRASDFIPKFNRRSMIARKVNEELRELLEDNSTDDTGAIRKAKDFFNACMNRDTIDKNRRKNLQAIVNATGGWLMLADPTSFFNTQNRLTWQQMHENVMKTTEFPGLFRITVDENILNRATYVITLDTLPTRLPPGLLEIAAVIDEFTESRNVPLSEILIDLLSIHRFMGNLIEIYYEDFTSEFDTQYGLTTIKEIQNIWDNAVDNYSLYQIDWLNTIRRRFEGMNVAIDETEIIALNPRGYLQRLGKLLSETPARTIENYIQMFNVYHIATSLDNTKELEVQGKPARWCSCCKHHKMEHALSLMYVRKHFAGLQARKTRDSISEIFNQLRETIKEGIDNYAMLNEKTRKLFRDKIIDMTIEIGYPEWYDVPDEVDEYYNELTLGSDHFENLLAVNRFESRKALLNLRLPAVATGNDWILPPIEVDAVSYHNIWNTIKIPAVVLQMPLFHYELPANLKFMMIGPVISHEIFHGFDMLGLNRDTAGILCQWLESVAMEKYSNKTDCIVNQFNKYPISRNPSTNEISYVNGNYTLTENMADNAGMRLSFKAFQRSKRLHPNEHVEIPGLEEYSEEKLFFYAQASFVCESWHRDFLLNPRLERHAPPRARTNLALSNLEEFSETFSCSPRENMNPSTKCVLWD